MGKLFDRTTTRNSLRQAWFHIRANGVRSVLQETRDAVETFKHEAELNIGRIQKWLREGNFSFDPQKGILKRKASGGTRGIVMASVRNRIVERALLNSLQNNVPFVTNVINTPTSVGGVPDRSVPHGLFMIRDAMKEMPYFVRADISGFFDHIPREEVIEKLSPHVQDGRFMQVLNDATCVVLANEKALGEDRKVFPTDEEGVAQGSPLSPLFGNILLNDFDLKFNERGIVCVRFIDDFVLLGSNEVYVRKAFMSARDYLATLGLRCHDPFNAVTSRAKAHFGKVDDGFVFLGYDIQPGLFQPSKESRDAVKHTIEKHIRRGRKAINDVATARNSFKRRQRYTQTLDILDRVIRGWGEAFAYSNVAATFDDLDKQIDKKIEDFRSWYRRKTRTADWRMKRRTGGVCLLTDVEPKSLDSLPYRLAGGRKFRHTQGTIVISTDGSVIGTGVRAGKDKGPGGWGAVFHADGHELCGRTPEATNNEMELTAVVEALKQTPEGARIKVRTDSQYVHLAAKGDTMVRSNRALWDVFQQLREAREVTVVWIRGHAGDSQNERADRLANDQANLAGSEAHGFRST
jgi:RNA-directed DNA polymerase